MEKGMFVISSHVTSFVSSFIIKALSMILYDGSNNGRRFLRKIEPIPQSPSNQNTAFPLCSSEYTVWPILSMSLFFNTNDVSFILFYFICF